MSFGLGVNGALGGAAQGATIGSAIPGIGTAVGGIIGRMYILSVSRYSKRLRPKLQVVWSSASNVEV